MQNEKCECKLAGYCQRHKIVKSEEQLRLCQTSEFYFQMWEDCKGPGQENIVCDHTDIVRITTFEQSPHSFPPLLEQAKNLIKDVAQHITSGTEKCTEEEIEKRLSICDTCEYLKRESLRCAACGCHLTVKSKWKSSKCPLSKWPNP